MGDIEEFSDSHLFEDLEHENSMTINQHDSVSLRSIAISLKRIADALHSDREGIGIGTYLSEISDYVIDLKKPSV